MQRILHQERWGDYIAQIGSDASESLSLGLGPEDCAACWLPESFLVGEQFSFAAVHWFVLSGELSKDCKY